MQTIKIPKEVMDVFYEARACEQLAVNSGFIKAVYYKTRAVKARALAMRALQAAHAATAKGEWHINITLGVATKEDDPAAMKPKRARKAKEVVPTTKGETV